MLQGRFQAVLQVQNVEQFRSEIVSFAENLGFRTVSAISVFDRPQDPPEFVTLGNTPPEYKEIFGSAARCRRDPVMQHCKTSARPIIWNQSTYVDAGLGEHWEEQAAFGYHSGVAMTLHLPGGKHFSLGVDLDGPLTRDQNQLTRMVADLQLFTVCAQEAASRVIFPTSFSIDAPQLTQIEIDSLHFAMEGKTASEIGKILSVSERTALSHLNNAMNMMGCSTKKQVALHVARLGLLR